MNIHTPTILIIEHISTLAHVYSLAVQSMGYASKIVNDGAQAIPYLRLHTPDVVLVDVDLLGLSTAEFLSYLRTQRQFRQTRVILLTADPLHNRQFSIWADTILHKPLQLKVLGQALRQLAPTQPNQLAAYARL